MRYLALCLLALLSSIVCYAQTSPAQVPAPATDVIVKRNGDEIAAHVDEVSPELIRYHRADNLTGPLFSILKGEVFMIRYANGTKDVFAQPRQDVIYGSPSPPLPPLNPAFSQAMPTQPPLTAADSVFIPLAAGGPRIGLTVIGNGRLREKMAEKFGASNVMTQFGWQFETRLFQLPGGTSGLVELVPLIGGLEQGLFLPSISGILGVRSRVGLEFGAGPNLSLAGAGLVLAVGHTARGKYVNVPFNFAVVPSGQGPRYSFLIGFTYHRPGVSRMMR